MDEKKIKALEKVKEEISKIDKKESNVFFFVLDTKGVASGSLEYIYKRLSYFCTVSSFCHRIYKLPHLCTYIVCHFELPPFFILHRLCNNTLRQPTLYLAKHYTRPV